MIPFRYGALVCVAALLTLVDVSRKQGHVHGAETDTAADPGGSGCVELSVAEILRHYDVSRLKKLLDQQLEAVNSARGKIPSKIESQLSRASVFELGTALGPKLAAATESFNNIDCKKPKSSFFSRGGIPYIDVEDWNSSAPGVEVTFFDWGYSLQGSTQAPLTEAHVGCLEPDHRGTFTPPLARLLWLRSVGDHVEVIACTNLYDASEQIHVTLCSSAPASDPGAPIVGSTLARALGHPEVARIHARLHCDY